MQYEELMNKKWQVTTALSNNKTDRYIILAAELMRFIHKSRREMRRENKAAETPTIVKPTYEINTWLIDYVLQKHAEYAEKFKIENAKIEDIEIKEMVS
jgi:hypothetical protein